MFSRIKVESREAIVSRPVISVIIPVYNDEKRILECVDSIFNQRTSSFSLEVIVVDNGSTDNTFSVAKNELLPKYENLRVEQCLSPGSYAARNHGLSVCKGEYTAFTDSDCKVSTDWLEHHLSLMKKQEGDCIIAGEVNFFAEASKSTEQSALDFESMFSMKQLENANNGKSITANFFCRKRIFDRHGLFDASLMSGGDVEMSQRVVRNGGKVVYCADAYVLHPARNVAELIKKRKRIVGGNWDSSLKLSRFSEKCAFLIRLFMTFLGRSKKVLKNRNLSAKRKAKLIVLLLKIMTVSYLELFKLMMGKSANRQ